MESILTDLPRHGKLVKNRAYRQVWRFEYAGKPYYLKFFPRRAKNRVAGNPAMREFKQLQQLQKAEIPSPRAVSTLVGYRLNGELGDALIIEGIEPSVALDQYLNEMELHGRPVPNRAKLAGQVADIVAAMGKAGLGHSDLHLGNFLLQEDKIFLIDAAALHRGGLRLADVAYLGASSARFATRSELVRGWHHLGQFGGLPKKSGIAVHHRRKFIRSSAGENDWFGRVEIGAWRGSFFKRAKFARRWSSASGRIVASSDWQAIWPALWKRLEAGELEKLKASRSGDVFAADISVAGKPFAVVIKRPYKRYWYRYINEIGRGSRAWRAWKKAWRVIIRDIPTAWPLLVLEKRTLGYITDSIIVFERVAGPTLDKADLDAIPDSQREMLFRRAGRLLRRIDDSGMGHFDAKSSNWIVAADAILGPRPVMIDVDGVRSRQWLALGINRLLRSMREHPQYTVKDSLNLCQGYAPFSSKKE